MYIMKSEFKVGQWDVTLKLNQANEKMQLHIKKVKFLKHF